MAKIDYNDFEQLAFILKRKIEKEFSLKKMSGNLVNTIEIKASPDSIQVSIPAPTYNMLEFQRKGVIVPTYHGSYSSKLNDVGSEFFVYPNDGRQGSYLVKPHNHIGFVDRVVKEAISEWLTTNARKYRKTKETDIGGQK